jgi:hypothetical protein
MPGMKSPHMADSLLEAFQSVPNRSEWQSMCEQLYGRYIDDFRQCLLKTLGGENVSDLLHTASRTLEAIGMHLGLEEKAVKEATSINPEYLGVQDEVICIKDAVTKSLVDDVRRAHRSASAWARAIEDHFDYNILNPKIIGHYTPDFAGSPSILRKEDHLERIA